MEEYYKCPILWYPKYEKYFKEPVKVDTWCDIPSVFEFEDAEEGPKVFKSKISLFLKDSIGKDKFISFSVD